VRVVDVVGEQREQRVGVVVVEVVAESGVEVLDGDADLEPLEIV